MKCIGLLFITCSVHADIFVEELNVTTNAKCSFAVGVNNGIINIKCSDPELLQKYNSLPDLSDYNENIKELKLLRKTVNGMVEVLWEEGQGARVFDKNISNLRNDLLQSKKELEKLWSEHDELRLKLAAVMAKEPDFTRDDIETTVQAVSESVAKAIFEKGFHKYSKALYEDIDRKLNGFRFELDNLKVTVDELKVLMNKFHEGNLREDIVFYGLSIGGTYLSGEWQSSFALEYERLMNNIPFLNIPGSVLVELKHINWEENKNYQTLPGLSPIEVRDNNEMTLLSVGSRIFMNKWKEDLRPYLGATFGYSIAGEEDTFNYSLAVGTEYILEFARVSFELKWEGFSNIESEEVTFNPLGSAIVKNVSELRDGWYAGIKVAFR